MQRLDILCLGRDRQPFLHHCARDRQQRHYQFRTIIQDVRDNLPLGMLKGEGAQLEGRKSCSYRGIAPHTHQQMRLFIVCLCVCYYQLESIGTACTWWLVAEKFDSNDCIKIIVHSKELRSIDDHCFEMPKTRSISISKCLVIKLQWVRSYTHP